METTPLQSDEQIHQLTPSRPRRNGYLATSVRFYLILAVPVLLTLISVRVVMLPWFVQFEYNRAGFPDDRYGLTTEERLEYAPYALEYLVNGEDISYLGDLTFPNGAPLFNDRELHHMEDVKVVTRNAFFLLFFGVLFTMILIFGFARVPQTRRWVQEGLLQGSVLTLGIIATIIVMAVVMWDTFFTGFHQMFFESGTWRFAYSDTLIRLFPEQFWFDAALTVGALTTVGAVLLLFGTWRWGKVINAPAERVDI